MEKITKKPNTKRYWKSFRQPASKIVNLLRVKVHHKRVLHNLEIQLRTRPKVNKVVTLSLMMETEG